MRHAADGLDDTDAPGASDDASSLVERCVGAFATVDDPGDTTVDTGGGIIVDVILQDA